MTLNNDDDEIVIVKLPKWKLEKLDKIIEERQAYDIVKSKISNWWIWTVVAGALGLIAFWDAIKIKVGG